MEGRIIIATHKPYWMPEDPVYLPVQVGFGEDLGFARDNTGENIAARNEAFCELTALYWAWQNVPGDFIGLAHYRRHFREPGGHGRDRRRDMFMKETKEGPNRQSLPHETNPRTQGRLDVQEGPFSCPWVQGRSPGRLGGGRGCRGPGGRESKPSPLPPAISLFPPVDTDEGNGRCPAPSKFASMNMPRDRRRRVLTGATLQGMLKGHDLLLPKPRRYWIETNASHYAHAHHAKDLALLRETIAQRAPGYLPAFDRVMQRTWGHRLNMFVMKRPLLEDYCAWLFDLLFAVESQLDRTGYSAYDKRVFGFLAERALDVWVEGAGLAGAYREVAVVGLEKVNWVRKGWGFLMRKVGGR